MGAVAPSAPKAPRRFRARSSRGEGPEVFAERYARAVPKIDRTPDGGKAD
jgi:hypothetical protein